MNDPLRRLKQLPWLPLCLTALLTIFWASVLDVLMWAGAIYVSLIGTARIILFTPPLNVIMELAIAMGLGALAVIFLEIVYPNIIINAGVLWALLLCLALAMLLKGLLPLPSVLPPVDGYTIFIGSMLGIFLKGKSYWRWG